MTIKATIEIEADNIHALSAKIIGLNPHIYNVVRIEVVSSDKQTSPTTMPIPDKTIKKEDPWNKIWDEQKKCWPVGEPFVYGKVGLGNLHFASSMSSSAKLPVRPMPGREG